MATTVDQQLETEIRLHLDKQAITEKLYVYCRAIDLGDTEMMRGAFWPDAFVDYGGFKGPVAETLFASSENSPFSAMHHNVFNPLVELHGDRALSEAHFIAWIYREDENGAYDAWTGGRYLDDFERREGDWRIVRRLVVHSWSRTGPKGPRVWDDGPLQGDLKFSRRDKTDLLYEALARLRAS